MELTERQWHEELATQIKEAELVIKRGEQSLVVYRARIGRRINAVYGAELIPFLDLEELTKIYDTKAYMLKQCRALAARTSDEEHVIAIASDYENWTGVVKGFLPGLTSKQTRRMVTDGKKESKTRRHLANVADKLRDDLIDRGGMSIDQAADAIRLWLYRADWREVKATYDKREELAAWHEMRAV